VDFSGIKGEIHGMKNKWQKVLKKIDLNEETHAHMDHVMRNSESEHRFTPLITKLQNLSESVNEKTTAIEEGKIEKRMLAEKLISEQQSGEAMKKTNMELVEDLGNLGRQCVAKNRADAIKNA
jgi:5'-deoxynucleotidase YfbR-like HD superfamily hydrolase